MFFPGMEHRAGLGRQNLLDILLGNVFSRRWWTFPNIANFFQMPGLRVKIWSLVKSYIMPVEVLVNHKHYTNHNSNLLRPYYMLVLFLGSQR